MRKFLNSQKESKLKYVFNFANNKVEAEDVVVINSLDYLADEFDLMFETPGPCYQLHVSNTENVPAEVVADVLHFLCEDVGEPMISFSVTSNEQNCEAWLTAAANLPGTTICEIHRPGRICYFVCVPAGSHWASEE